jgi:hypothetical protein
MPQFDLEVFIYDGKRKRSCHLFLSLCWLLCLFAGLGVFEYRNGVFQFLILLVGNNWFPLLIFELTQLMGESLGEGKQVPFQTHHRLPFLI